MKYSKILIIITICMWLGVMLFGFSVYNIVNHSPLEKTLFNEITYRYTQEQQDQYQKVHVIKPEVMYELDIESFRDILQLTYYDIIKNMTSPCQFYSSIWSDYLEYNNIDYKFVYTNNHIFVIAYTEKNYTILDQLEVITVELNS